MTEFTKIIKKWKWPELPEELLKIVKTLEIGRLTISKLSNSIKQELAKSNKDK